MQPTRCCAHRCLLLSQKHIPLFSLSRSSPPTQRAHGLHLARPRRCASTASRATRRGRRFRTGSTSACSARASTATLACTSRLFVRRRSVCRLLCCAFLFFNVDLPQPTTCTSTNRARSGYAKRMSVGWPMAATLLGTQFQRQPVPAFIQPCVATNSRESVATPAPQKGSGSHTLCLCSIQATPVSCGGLDDTWPFSSPVPSQPQHDLDVACGLATQLTVHHLRP
jgi:hypothetical protein